MSLHKKLFLLLVFLIPINLGKHFIFKWSYVDGLLVDYLIPTLYVQDILVCMLLTVWAVTPLVSVKTAVKFSSRFSGFLILFVASLMLSIFNSKVLYVSLFAFSRFVLYLLLSFYVYVEIKKEDFFKIVAVLSVAVSLLSVLAITQWYKQGAVFNNYLFFGEQPYTISTPLINRESFLGSTVVPPYGTFSHPNVFGCYLSIFLVWMFYYSFRRKYLLVPFSFGLLSLLLTFSLFAIIAFFVGTLALLLFFKITPCKVTRLLSVFTLVVMVASLFLPLLSTVSVLKDKPSFYIRSGFLSAAWPLIKENSLFGVGFNASTVLIEQHLRIPHMIRFVQPVHNMFVLLLLESGVFTLGFGVTIIYLVYRRLLRKLCSYNKLTIGSEELPVALPVFISFIQVLFLGSFDHYFITINQTRLMVFIIFGLIMAFTVCDNNSVDKVGQN